MNKYLYLILNHYITKIFITLKLYKGPITDEQQKITPYHNKYRVNSYLLLKRASISLTDNLYYHLSTNIKNPGIHAVIIPSKIAR